MGLDVRGGTRREGWTCLPFPTSSHSLLSRLLARATVLSLRRLRSDVGDAVLSGVGTFPLCHDEHFGFFLVLCGLGEFSLESLPAAEVCYLQFHLPDHYVSPRLLAFVGLPLLGSPCSSRFLGQGPFENDLWLAPFQKEFIRPKATWMYPWQTLEMPDHT